MSLPEQVLMVGSLFFGPVVVCALLLAANGLATRIAAALKGGR